MKHKVFIDGQAGTTGLEIYQRMQARDDVELLLIDEEKRKDVGARRACINQADIVFLCLPDAAAKEAVALVENDRVKVIDASTAHRTAPGWAYGFAELSPAHRRAVAESRRIANPGCHASGMIAIVYPLIALGILPRDYPVCCHSLTGYSGGGKAMIAQYEAEERDAALDSPRTYGLNLVHKHLPEMQHVTGLAQPPLFSPIVCDFYSGMAVSVPLYMNRLAKPLSADNLAEALEAYYKESVFLSVERKTEGFLPANALAGTNRMRLYVCGNDAQAEVISVFDNLGKGASGAAMQNMNIALGLAEDAYF
nr:N-acetyl-gamma-glutamyl-phosphate reductase [Maliibacterium massiliense]